MLKTTDYNVRQLQQRGVAHEVVFVEWNPIPDRSLLSEKVIEQFPTSRCVVVDRSLHTYISGNRHIALFEYHAKNVGVRFARGTWILLMNPDNYLGTDVLDFLQSGDFDDQSLYRSGWINIRSAADVDAPGWVDQHAEDEPPYCSASGDFVFCARTLFDRIGGYREDLRFTNTHKDGIFCRAAMDLTGRVRKIGNTYHLSHGRDNQGKRRLTYDWQAVDRTPQSVYGHPDEGTVAEVSSRMLMLRLRESLSAQLAGKRPPTPYVPWRLRLKKLKLRWVFQDLMRLFFRSTDRP